MAPYVAWYLYPLLEFVTITSVGEFGQIEYDIPGLRQTQRLDT